MTLGAWVSRPRHTKSNAATDIAPVAAFDLSVDYTQLPHPFVVVTRSIVIDIFAIIY